jgi:hypothetical protein
MLADANHGQSSLSKDEKASIHSAKKHCGKELESVYVWRRVLTRA